MKNKFLLIFLTLLILTSCVGTGSKGFFGTGVSIALDPRSLGTQIDDSIMQKNLVTRLILLDKNYFLSINAKVLDGRIFLTGKVDNPEEKLQITKSAWETAGVRSVRNKNIKSATYNIDTYKKKIFIYGIATTSDERKEVINEAKQIVDVKEVVASILLVEDLRIQKD